MSDLDDIQRKVTGWLQPLGDESAPCGPDLEQQNDFLALTQAAAGKPESQWSEAVPPDWRAVRELSEDMLDRSRDLRIGILWVRSVLRMEGFAALPAGLQLIQGLLDGLWEHVHPLPDPDDQDLYARVNALTTLTQYDGLIGDLRGARVVTDRALGELTGRGIEIASGLATARAGEPAVSRDQAAQMLVAAVARDPGLRDAAVQAVDGLQSLATKANERLGFGVAPDLKPILVILKAVLALMPAPPAEAAEDAAEDGIPEASGQSGGSALSRRGLSGEVTSRDEAIRAIDMVCAYLEVAEPANPAPLFLRRARQLISHNFLQLMKVLAPDSLGEVARVVGIDPDTVETPDGS